MNRLFFSKKQSVDRGFFKKMDCIAFYDSPLGKITMASDGAFLIGLWFNGARYFAESLFAEHQEKNCPIFDETRRWLDLYFSGICPHFTPPLLMRTTAFRQQVWEILLQIPFGKTSSYGEIAKQIAAQHSTKNKSVKKICAQAVGNAVAHNAISLIIPCHRVIGKNGNLTGFAAGIDKKQKLLALEKAHNTSFFYAKKQ